MKTHSTKNQRLQQLWQRYWHHVRGFCTPANIPIWVQTPVPAPVAVKQQRLSRQRYGPLPFSLLFYTILALLVGCTAIAPDRSAPGSTLPTGSTPAPVASQVPAAQNQRQVLAMQLGIDVNAVTIAEVTPTTWPNACLGKPDPTELCAAAITPGYQITLVANGDTYRYHTNVEGDHVRLAGAPKRVPDPVVLSWSHLNGHGCDSAQIGLSDVAWGRCQGTLMHVPLLNPNHQQAIAEFYVNFAPFEATTVAGEIQFNGAGTQTATPAQQRMLAEWARLVWQEAAAGRSGASWGLALAWHREGGLAGFCDDVAVYVTGEVYLSACHGEEPVDLAHFRLGAAELATLFTWLDRYAPFEYQWSDPATSDAMTVTLVFAGVGEQEAHGPEQALLVDFAQNLFNEGKMTAADLPAACPKAMAGEQILFQPDQGYCLLYPAVYNLWQQSPTVTEIVSQTIMNHIDPRLSISVEAANGETLTTVVERLLADFVAPGFAIEAEPITVAGVEAILLDEVPGQDLGRRVVLLHNERRYSFFLAPIGEADTAIRREADLLYQTVIDSFQLLERASQ